MSAIMLLSTFIILQTTRWSSASDICPTCLPPLSTMYEAQKQTIETILEGTPSFFNQQFQNASDIYLLNGVDKATVTTWLGMIEEDVIKNESLTTAEKLTKLAVKIDQFFVLNANIENIMKFQMLGSWGPLINFQYITDEWNIPTFWTLTTTPGSTTSCMIYDRLMAASKSNKVIQKSLCLEQIPCTMSFAMISIIVNLHYDIPTKNDQIYLRSLEIPDANMTVNQYQRIGTAYFGSKSMSCQRLMDMFANFPASKLDTAGSLNLKTMLNLGKAALPSGTSTDKCIAWFSGEVADKIKVSEKYIGWFNKIFWNRPYGSFYDTIIYADCQQAILKSSAPEYYS